MNNLIKLYYRLFPQWVMVKCYTAKFHFIDTNTFEYAFYKLYKSKDNRYKMKMEGFKPETHEMYGIVLNKLAELNNKENE